MWEAHETQGKSNRATSTAVRQAGRIFEILTIFAKKNTIEMKEDITKLEDLTPDGENFNRHTEFGSKLLEDSLRKFGAGRSILIDKDGNVIAGNGVVETAAAIGMEDVIVVKTDGTKLVAVQRTDLDLDSPEGRELALADNMTALKGIDIDLAKVQAKLGDDLAKAWGMEIPKMPQNTNGEIDLTDTSDRVTMTLSFSIEENAFVIDSLSKIDANKENAILHLLGYGHN